MYLMGAKRIVSQLSKDDVLIIRPSVSVNDQHGRSKQSAPTKIPIKASVQKPTFDQLQVLPEGSRSKESIYLITNNEIKGASVESRTKPDMVVWNGKTYSVEKVIDWSHITGHYEAIAVELPL